MGFASEMTYWYFETFPRPENGNKLTTREAEELAKWDLLPGTLAERAIVIARNTAEKRGEVSLPLSYVVEIAKNLAEREAEYEPESAATKAEAQIKRYLAKTRELEQVHGFQDHALKFGCRGPVCVKSVKVPSGAQEKLL